METNVENKHSSRNDGNTVLAAVLSDREKWVLHYLKGCYETDYPLSGGWVTPTQVGAAYGWFVLQKQGCHSATGSPICKSLVAKGMIERNERGHYRWLPSNGC